MTGAHRRRVRTAGRLLMYLREVPPESRLFGPAVRCDVWLRGPHPVLAEFGRAANWLTALSEALGQLPP
jgi:hypothetical protein